MSAIAQRRIQQSASPGGVASPDDARSEELGYDVEDFTSATGDDELLVEPLPIDELEGVATLQKPRGLLIAISVAARAGFDWTPTTIAEVEWDSGRTVDAKVVEERSTGAGHVELGQTV